MLKRFLSFTFLIFMFVPGLYAGSKKNQNNKAIIISPGIFGSGLFYRSDLYNAWYDNNEAIWLPINEQDKWRTMKGILKLKCFYEDLFLDENGEPLNNEIGLPLENVKFPHEVDARVAKYGTLDTYRKLILILKRKIPNYKVILLNYDWRNSNEFLDRLEEVAKPYDKVVLIGFSFGGVLNNKFAAKCHKDGKNDKIEKIISVAAPHLGSVVAFHVLEKGFPDHSTIEKFLGFPEMICKMSRNFPTTLCLWPHEKYFQKFGGYIVDIDGKRLNYEETIDLAEDRFCVEFTDECEKFHDDSVIGGKHVLEYYDSYFIVGAGVETPSEIAINSDKLGDIEITEFVDGDGTVEKRSAVPFDVDKNHIFVINGEKHNDLIKNNKVIANIVSIISSKAAHKESKPKELEPAA